MNRPLLYAMLILFFFLQLLFSDFASIAGAKPDLGVILVVFVAFFFGAPNAFEAALVFGLLKDIYASGVFGSNAVSLALTALAAGALSSKLSRESRLMQPLAVFVFSLLYFALLYAVSAAASMPPRISLDEYMSAVFIPSSFYTAAVSLVLFPFLIGKFGVDEEKEYL
jgi:rod shape-determining protein MreD